MISRVEFSFSAALPASSAACTLIFSITYTLFGHMHAHIHCCTCSSHTRMHAHTILCYFHSFPRFFPLLICHSIDNFHLNNKTYKIGKSVMGFPSHRRRLTLRMPCVAHGGKVTNNRAGTEYNSVNSDGISDELCTDSRHSCLT